MHGFTTSPILTMASNKHAKGIQLGIVQTLAKPMPLSSDRVNNSQNMAEDSLESISSMIRLDYAVQSRERTMDPEVLPPPLDHRKSPYATVPLPSIVDSLEPVRISSKLFHGCGTYTGTAVNWDFRTTKPSAFSHGHASWLDEGASIPPLPFMTILADQLPRPVFVHHKAAKSFVTVGDVLEAIAEAWQNGVDAKQEAVDVHTGKQGGDQLSAESQLEQFCVRSKFAGLSPSELGSDVWILHLEI